MKKIVIILSFIFVLNACKTDDDIKVSLKISEVQRIGSESGSDENIIGRSSFLSIGKDGSVFIVDDAFNNIKKFNSKGILVKTIGAGEGEGPGEFKRPGPIYVDAYSNIYCIDLSLGRVTVFDSLGNVMSVNKVRMRPADIVAISPHEVFVTGFADSYDGDLIHKYDFLNESTNTPTIIFCERYKGENAWEIERAGMSNYLILDKNNDVFCINWYPYVIRKFTKEGKLLFEINREVDFFKPPILKRVEPRYISAQSGIWCASIYDQNYLVCLLCDFHSNKGEVLTYYDTWDLRTKKHIGISQIDRNYTDIGLQFKFDNDGFLFTTVLEPYPHLKKYKFQMNNILDNHSN